LVDVVTCGLLSI